MDIRDFDYYLPQNLIAQNPLQKRDQSRLLVLDRQQRSIEHRYFYEIIDLLCPGDLLVFNDSRVIPARLYGRRADTGGKLEVLLLHPLKPDNWDTWEALVKPSKRARPGIRFVFGEGLLEAEGSSATTEGHKILRFYYTGKFDQLLEKLGEIPLPPYIKEHYLEDKERYQTVYARKKGSVAAPTAGLHFTKDILNALRAKGVKTVFLTLHVGAGTFRPIKEKDPANHQMHSEYYCLEHHVAKAVNKAKRGKHRVIAVGTTSCRVLEACAVASGVVNPSEGWTDLFIYPGYQFKIVDSLLTNFHLPRSTLLMLVSAFAGREMVIDAYKEAIAQKYRFYSFGDCMFIC
ncbi:MAG: tRNA preQ1(34) S-adenosylmethionine ribosyltransferase-isomerase QueA [Firmicutes bacterium]|nr:tRNA preQ1(34) S-adenosylmethionine ribosyltransferase-isomerase QueA [Bacillota bacterium]